MSTPSIIPTTVLSTTVVSTVSTTASTTSSVASSCPNLNDPPVRDAACAIPYSDDNIKHMSDCCEDADVVAYYDNCGLYCRAEGQNIRDLTNCLYEKKVPYQNVFCRGPANATASESGTPTFAPSASASVIVEGDDDKDDDDNNGGNGNGSGNGNGNGDNNDNDDSAASRPGMGVMGVTIGALVFSALFGGALQL
jgi:hypothetical protein